MATPIEQQPVNKLAPFTTTSALIEELVSEKITFSDGTTISTASQGGGYTSPLECGTF